MLLTIYLLAVIIQMVYVVKMTDAFNVDLSINDYLSIIILSMLMIPAVMWLEYKIRSYKENQE